MLTDDVQIDRRILLEAESLHRCGHEVIVIAEHVNGGSDFERIGNVKVERLRSPELSANEALVLHVSALISFGLSRCSAVIQRGLNLLASLSSRFFSLLIRLFNLIVGRAGLLVQSLLGALSRVSSGFFSIVLRGFGFLIRRTSWIVLRLLSVLSLLTSKVFSFFINLNQMATSLALRINRRLRGLPLRERRMLDRIAFYDADVVHAHDLPQLRVGAKAKRRLGVPLIYDAHELYPEIGTLSAAQKKMLSRRERRYVRGADAVITVNQYLAEEMRQRYGIPLPEVILNATDWPTDLTADVRWDRFRERFGIPQHHQVVLFQGWMSRQRGLQPLVRAMSFLPPTLHLVFMGYGEGRDELVSIASEENLTDRVHFMDAVPQSELLAWTSSADLGVIPYQPVDLNNYYCSPNKLFEFIQAELPIVANDLPFLRDVVVGEGFGVVHKLEDPKDYAEAILKLCDKESLERCKLRLKERKSAYSWTAEEGKLLHIYDALATGRERGA